MKFDDIMALVRAGYTAQQIEEMNNSMQEESKEEPVESVETKEEPVVNQPDYTDMLNKLSDKIDGVEKSVQRQNIKNEEMPIEPQETFMDNINELIRMF